MPHEHAAGLQHTRELVDHATVVRGQREKPERREQIEHRVKASRPARGKFPHVAARVTKQRSGAAMPCALEQFLRVVEAVDVESRFRQQMRVSSLPARDVEDARARGKTQDVHQARDFAPVALEGEKRLVLEQVLAVEVTLPPLGGLRSLRHLMKIHVLRHPSAHVIPSAARICFGRDSADPSLALDDPSFGASMSDDRSISRRDAVKLGLGAGVALAVGRSGVLSAEQQPALITRPIPSSGERLPIVGMGTAVIYQNPKPERASAAA